MRFNDPSWDTNNNTHEPQDRVHKKFALLRFLYLIMSKNSIFSHSATLSKAPPPVWPHYLHTHTKQVKTLHMDLSWNHFNSSLQAKGYIWPQFWLCWLSRKIWHTSTQTKQNWAQFQKAQLALYKTRYAFCRSPPGQGVLSTNILPVITPRMELSYTHSR